MSYLQEHHDTLDTILETWRPVVGYEGLYEVSDLGRVRTLNYRTSQLPVVRKQREERDGYRRIALSLDGVYEWIPVHRLVMAAFVGPCPENMEVNHKDGVKHNNSLENLEYCTRSDNRKHGFRTGLISQTGSKNNASKLTEDKVVAMRAFLAAGFSQSQVASRFGVSQGAVGLVYTRKRWAHVEGGVF